MGIARSKHIISDQATPLEASIVVEQLVGHTIAEVERELILTTLYHFGGNRTRASVALGISLRRLRDKIRHFRAEGLDVRDARPGPFYESKTDFFWRRLF